jgi:hypothetical protein
MAMRSGSHREVGELSARPEKIKKQFFKYEEYTCAKARLAKLIHSIQVN